MIVETAHACSCAEPQPIATELKNADAVFTGRVLEITKPLVMTSSLDPIRVTLDVSQSWKGADQKIIDVSTASSSASCGYPNFEQGEEYLVFARQSADGLNVSLCSRTQPLSRATDDIAELRTIQASTIPERIPEVEVIMNDGLNAFHMFFVISALLVLYYILWKKKISQWSRKRRILFSWLAGYLSIGILLNVYFLSYGPSISRIMSDGEFVMFIQSVLYFTFLWPLIFGLGTFGALAIPGVIGFIAILIAWIKGRKVLVVGIFCTFLFLFVSLFIPVTTSSESELSTLEFGKPFTFVTQDQSQYSPPFPWEMQYGIAREHPTRIHWPQFFLSLAIVGGGVAAVLAGGQMLVRQVRPRKGQHGRVDYSGKKAMKEIAKLHLTGPRDLSTKHDRYLYDEPYRSRNGKK